MPVAAGEDCFAVYAQSTNDGAMNTNNAVVPRARTTVVIHMPGMLMHGKHDDLQLLVLALKALA